MNAGTNYVTLDKRIVENTYRPSLRLTEDFGEEDSSTSGWTWAAALTIAALFIVSGHLDQAARNPDATSPAQVAEKYASNTAAPQALPAGAHNADHQAEKGY